MAEKSVDMSQLARELMNFTQPTHEWMNTAMTVFTQMINEDQEPRFVIEYRNGVKIEVRVNEVPEVFSRKTIELKGYGKAKGLQ